MQKNQLELLKQALVERGHNSTIRNDTLLVLSKSNRRLAAIDVDSKGRLCVHRTAGLVGFCSAHDVFSEALEDVLAVIKHSSRTT